MSPSGSASLIAIHPGTPSSLIWTLSYPSPCPQMVSSRVASRLSTHHQALALRRLAVARAIQLGVLSMPCCACRPSALHGTFHS
eukprot:13339542-Heterocapsa_arctica.AAC.1